LTNNGLEEIYLDSNVIGDIGAQAISNLLDPKAATLLRTISIVSNRITDVGATAILEKMAKNTGLLSLNMDANPISASIMSQITAKLEKNCCAYLYTMVLYREEDLCSTMEELTKGCFDNAKILAQTIMDYYEPQVQCCARVRMNRCL